MSYTLNCTLFVLLENICNYVCLYVELNKFQLKFILFEILILIKKILQLIKLAIQKNNKIKPIMPLFFNTFVV